jgi:hypothetical protein
MVKFAVILRLRQTRQGQCADRRRNSPRRSQTQRPGNNFVHCSLHFEKSLRIVRTPRLAGCTDLYLFVSAILADNGQKL